MSVSRVLLASLALAACGPADVTSPTAARPLAAAAGVDVSRWMAQQSDAVSLADLTIPGSHESAALYEPFPGTAKCQNLDLRQQLDIGIRYFDIRVRQVNNAFVIHHGSIYQHANFDDVLGACLAFLQANPSEAIVMELSGTYTSSGSTESNEATFLRYANRPQYAAALWRGTSIPTLGQVRGKIVLLRRFGGTAQGAGGVDVTGWVDNGLSSLTDAAGTPIVIQDFYQVSASTNDNKWGAITSLLQRAATSGGRTWFINFTSGYRSFIGIPDITGVSKDINGRLANYWATPLAHGPRYGTVVSDFVTAPLVRAMLEAR